MPLTIKTREGANKNFDTTYSDVLSERYVDGIGEVMIGPVISKLILFQTRPIMNVDQRMENGEHLEMRIVDSILTLPTGALVEFTKKVLEAVQGHGHMLAMAIDEQKSRILPQVRNQIPTIDPLVLNVPPESRAKKATPLQKSPKPPARNRNRKS